MLHKLPGTLQENHWFGSAILPSSRPPPTPFSLPFSPQISSSCRVSHLTSIIGTPRQCATREGNGLLYQHPLKRKIITMKKKKKNKAVSPTPPSSLAAERELLEGRTPARCRGCCRAVAAAGAARSSGVSRRRSSPGRPRSPPLLSALRSSLPSSPAASASRRHGHTGWQGEGGE